MTKEKQRRKINLQFIRGKLDKGARILNLHRLPMQNVRGSEMNSVLWFCNMTKENINFAAEAPGEV